MHKIFLQGSCWCRPTSSCLCAATRRQSPTPSSARWWPPSGRGTSPATSETLSCPTISGARAILRRRRTGRSTARRWSSTTGCPRCSGGDCAPTNRVRSRSRRRNAGGWQHPLCMNIKTICNIGSVTLWVTFCYFFQNKPLPRAKIFQVKLNVFSIYI